METPLESPDANHIKKTPGMSLCPDINIHTTAVCDVSPGGGGEDTAVEVLVWSSSWEKRNTEVSPTFATSSQKLI